MARLAHRKSAFIAHILLIYLHHERLAHGEKKQSPSVRKLRGHCVHLCNENYLNHLSKTTLHSKKCKSVPCFVLTIPSGKTYKNTPGTQLR